MADQTTTIETEYKERYTAFLDLLGFKGGNLGTVFEFYGEPPASSGTSFPEGSPGKSRGNWCRAIPLTQFFIR